MQNMFLVILSAEEAVKKLKKYVDIGFTEIVLTSSSPNRNELVHLVAEKIIPYLNE